MHGNEVRCCMLGTEDDGDGMKRQRHAAAVTAAGKRAASKDAR